MLDGLGGLLERRRNFLREFEPLFPKERYTIPVETVFGDESELLNEVTFLAHPEPVPLPAPPPPLPISLAPTPTGMHF